MVIVVGVFSPCRSLSKWRSWKLCEGFAVPYISNVHWSFSRFHLPTE